ncbi:hypothetical protein LPAF129_16810 [Ligilactobacillus pabuli]|uniref:DUF4811 domain-containing protein n=1 Tax=Ligilactobacillus pabuli TaxID=2886039 RepID=A0ABQ5JIX4_9LACO|nr:DUF4811 domain-containing protein [Ligilactobacillus pabuli]GKS81995.1 hypothetical protein LPAF129_16810 [Ligilactobacillus pabuli]
MGIALLFISVLLVTYCMIFMPHSVTKYVWVGASVLLLALDATALILNDTNHFGMKKVVQTQTRTLVSSTKSAKRPQLLYRKLGNGQEKIYYYRVNKAAKVQATDPMITTVTVKRAAVSRLQITKKYWDYSSPWAKVFFAGGQPNHQFIDQHFAFEIGQEWQLKNRAE